MILARIFGTGSTTINCGPTNQWIHCRAPIFPDRLRCRARSSYFCRWTVRSMRWKSWPFAMTWRTASPRLTSRCSWRWMIDQWYGLYRLCQKSYKMTWNGKVIFKYIIHILMGKSWEGTGFGAALFKTKHRPVVESYFIRMAISVWWGRRYLRALCCRQMSILQQAWRLKSNLKIINNCFIGGFPMVPSE